MRKVAMPKIPKSHEAGETSYTLTAETHYYPKPPKMAKMSHATVAKPSKPEPMPVKVVGTVKTR